MHTEDNNNQDLGVVIEFKQRDHTYMIHTSDNIHFVNIADLRTEPKRLSADSGVRQRPADRQVQVVGPRHRRQSMF